MISLADFKSNIQEFAFFACQDFADVFDIAVNSECPNQRYAVPDLQGTAAGQDVHVRYGSAFVGIRAVCEIYLVVDDQRPVMRTWNDEAVDLEVRDIFN
ncbi:MAG: hypothetical protein LBT40_09465 [Deltaproteobacteria bacterium]|nr:hypothetical protein [Deltaproteobacteria bacterium]